MGKEICDINAGLKGLYNFINKASPQEPVHYWGDEVVQNVYGD